MNRLASKKVTIALFVIYLLVLFCTILLKSQFNLVFVNIQFRFGGSEITRSINLVPFGGMLMLNGEPSYGEVFFNTWVFVPFGMFLCMLIKKKSFVKLLAPIVLTSLLFEALQYVFVLGASDVTDVIANTLGGLIGALLFFILHKACKKHVNGLINIMALTIVLVIGLALCAGVIRIF